MTFNKIVLSPILYEGWQYSLSSIFKRYNITSKCIFITPKSQSSFHQYAEGLAIIEFASEYEASVALKAAQREELEFAQRTLQAVPLHDDYSPIKILPDGCLKRIFLMLPVSKNLAISKVCKHWENIASQCSYAAAQFDVNDLVNFTDIKNCVIKYGSCLKEVRYNAKFPMSLLGNYCNNLENLVICCSWTNIAYNRPDMYLQSTWSRLGNLRRLQLKNIPAEFDGEVLSYLPKTLIELHLGCLDGSHAKRYKSSLDLSTLSHIQSLTLIDFEFTDARISGFQKLTNLKHLYIHSCNLNKMHEKSLCSFGHLEYLATKKVVSIYEPEKCNWDTLFYNSSTLVCRQADDSYKSPANSSSRTLRYIKYIDITDPECDVLKNLADKGLPHLEHLDCQGSTVVTDDLLFKIIAASPHLKFVYAAGCNITENIVPRVASVTMRRTSGVVLRLFVGADTLHKWNDPPQNLPNLILDEVPKPEDLKLNINTGWFTGNYKPSDQSPLEPTLLDDSSPILTLPTECLCVIFSYLSMDDMISVEEVCNRWKSIIVPMWKKVMKFDMRDLRYLENGAKCVARCGHNLDEIYYYSDYDASVIGKYCNRVKHVVIDFDQKKFDSCEHQEKHNECDLVKSLSKLKSLTRLMLKNVDHGSHYDFVEHLSQPLTDIHIFAKDRLNPIKTTLSNFSDLRALTLTDFEPNEDNVNSVFFEGLSELKSLTYLRLEDVDFSTFDNPLVDMTKLEYLSLECPFQLQEYDLATILENNKNLKYLNLSSYDDLSNEGLVAISHLQNLKTLCLASICPDYMYDQFEGLPNLEYFNFEGSIVIEPNALMNMISSSPKLKILHITEDQYDVQSVVDAAERATWDRTNGIPLKLCLGTRIERKNIICSPYVLPCSQLSSEEKMVFKIDYYRNWYVKP